MLLASVFTITAIMPRSAHATVVEIQTILGSFQVNLTDEATPVTVANFLTYVNDSSYTNSISHRSVPGFIVQAGGFAFDGITPIVDIESNDPIINEPLYSNLRGTIAMAKFDGDPNSATNPGSGGSHGHTVGKSRSPSTCSSTARIAARSSVISPTAAIS